MAPGAVRGIREHKAMLVGMQPARRRATHDLSEAHAHGAAEVLAKIHLLAAVKAEPGPCKDLHGRHRHKCACARACLHACLRVRVCVACETDIRTRDTDRARIEGDMRVCGREETESE